MNRPSWRRDFALALELIVGAVLLAAGVLKIWDFHGGGWGTQQFYTDVSNFHLVGSTFAIVIATALPWVEVTVGAALLLRRLRAGALALTILLTAVFLVALTSAWIRGLDISCGCFGKETNATNFPLHIGADIALLVAAVFCFCEESSRKIAAGSSSPPL